MKSSTPRGHNSGPIVSTPADRLTPGCQRWWPRATRRTMAVESGCDTLREEGTC